MKLSGDLKAFEARIGYEFRQPELLIRALTHSSMSSPTRLDNQRLEFLGDRVLGLVIAEALMAGDAEASEGQLAPRYNALVRKETCAEMARQLDIGAVLKLGRSEMMSGGRRKTALLGDAMEALIAAIHLDGGMDAARKFILGLWSKKLASVDDDARDPKTALQEWAQARGLQPPVYTETARSGPDHAPIFTIEASLSNGASASAAANSKRAAEQSAARELLEKLDA
ncbi:ribonuclease III [Rhodobacteraceae bacterium 63075]|nr:ribonuclease III [Rhodobacteraceae bacterium 63075]